MALVRTASSLGDDGGTVIAIDRDKATNGQFLVKWAVDNLLRAKRKPFCVIIHVLNHNSSHSQTNTAKDKDLSAEEHIQKIFLPCLGYCARKGVKAKEMIMHDIDVPNAIVDYIVKNEISNVVVGASNRNVLIRKFKEADVPSSLLKTVPEFCSVYVISKGKPQTIRAATKRLESTKQYANKSSDRSNTGSNLLSQASLSSEWPSTATNSSTASVSSSHGQTSHQSFASNDGFSWIEDQSFDLSFQSENSLESFTTLEGSGNSFVLQNPEDLEVEMSRLNLQLKQTMDIYNSVYDEAKLAKDKVNELNLKPTKERSLEEAESAEDAAHALAELERKKTRVATEAAHIAERVAEIETQKRKLAEMRARQEEGETAVQGGAKYRRYSVQEIEAATGFFHAKKKIGEGGYGPVYKGFLDHTAVAIKILRPDISQGIVQFQQEVEVLSFIRHPNMVLLLGACPDYGCLIYEYMDNGSLHDRLFLKSNTPPLPWRARFRIAAEVATGLLFLHNRRPHPLVHRDLKPANILLDRNLVAKIADVGLACLIPSTSVVGPTMAYQTTAVGTFCYIDPEYQQTGLLGVKSDVYSLGVVLLQILTGRLPIGLALRVEDAIESGEFGEVLDPTVGDWPVEEAMAMARLALRCCEMRRRDRPDLGDVVLPELNWLRDLAMRS